MSGAHAARWTLARRRTDRGYRNGGQLAGRHHIEQRPILRTSTRMRYAVEDCIIRVFTRTGEPRMAKLIMNSRYGKTWPGSNLGTGA